MDGTVGSFGLWLIYGAFWPASRVLKKFRESFCESGEGVRLPRERGRPPGKSGELPGKSGNFRGSLGNFRGTSGLLLSSTVRDLPGKSPKTSGEVRGLSRSSGEPDSLPATRQICLQEMGRILKGQPIKGGVRCKRFERTLSVVLKSLSQGFYGTFLGPKEGFDKTFLGV